MALSIAAYSSVHEESHGYGFVEVNEVFWGAYHNTPYPFTTNGEISCGIHPEFGPAVYFEPEGFVDESSIGTPLKKAAAESLKQADMTPNVPYSVKKGADLSEVREIRLKACSEMYEDI
ncbi:hypothetical protein [Psychrobacter sp. PAMC 21119]|uniref:hypothetical protein n=1 Tax=Psychrobacter sp. PAMC 21119 TaxID=1112209 RepID=UPI000287C9F5|nr:hypothetical protein [Psychrobacter sp. PAMC 21119]